MEKKLSTKKLKPAVPLPLIFENEAWIKGQFVIGIDEVGRGCFFGPVVVCALMLHKNKTHPLLKDSKILSAEERNEAAQWLKNNSWYSFGIINHALIDSINIYQATLLGMKRAYWNLMLHPHVSQFTTTTPVLVDAMPLFLDETIIVHSFIRGESQSISIAAASIMAKVMRDELMQRLHAQFPLYAINTNKGYGTAQHAQALGNYGPSILHRKTFIQSQFPSFSNEDNSHETTKQRSLFG